MRMAHNGLELWYSTPDAPAPADTLEPRRGVSVTVGVRPARPANAVQVRYRVDGQRPQTIAALRVANDFTRDCQYFRATFPTFWSGRVVEYLPILSCGGRHVPDPETAATFPSTFQIDQSAAARQPDPPVPDTGTRFPFRLEYLVTKRVTLAPRPELVGETPQGFIIHWSPTGGTVDGPAFRAIVHPEGEHEMIVRPDGIGEQSVRVTLETDDHALISVRYTGLIDLGFSSVALARNAVWPVSAPVRSAPRLLTSHPRYRWLNRLQCFGIGEVRPYDLLYIYDLYAVR
jgi:hypothetical protein